MIRLRIEAISSNTNAFGLRSMILFGENGQVYQALSNELNLRPIHDVLEIGTENFFNEESAARTYLIRSGYECIKRLPDAPQNVVDAVFNNLPKLEVNCPKKAKMRTYTHKPRRRCC